MTSAAKVASKVSKPVATLKVSTSYDPWPPCHLTLQYYLYSHISLVQGVDTLGGHLDRSVATLPSLASRWPRCPQELGNGHLVTAGSVR